MPTVIVFVLIGAVAYYVGYIFPATAEMFVKFGIDLKANAPMTYATMGLSDFMRNNILWLMPAFLGPMVGL